jgi:hypothetical protein
LRLLLVLGLVVGAAPAWAAADQAAPQQPIVLGGVEVTILPTIAPASGPESAMTVQIDVEARTDEATRLLGFKSLLGETTIDCRSGANRFEKAAAYDQPDRQGPPRSSHLSGQWVTPASGSYMAKVTERVCASRTTSAVAAPAVIEAPSPPPAASHPTTSPPASPTPEAAAAAVPPAAGAQPAPQASVTPAPPPEAPPKVVVMAPPAAPAPVASSKSASPTTRPARPGKVVAQVAAAPDARAAQKVLDRLRDLIAPPLSTKVEAATVQNVKLYRASVDGFATVADARAFCAKAAGVSKTCWVHVGALPTAKPS